MIYGAINIVPLGRHLTQQAAQPPTGRHKVLRSGEQC
jgi:hypothetical protein